MRAHTTYNTTTNTQDKYISSFETINARLLDNMPQYHVRQENSEHSSMKATMADILYKENNDDSPSTSERWTTR